MKKPGFLALMAASLFMLDVLTAAARNRKPIDPDEGTLASVKPRIPEPMVFDLVRPLGAKRGELEVNSLFRVPTGSQSKTLLWAPEVEYTFADGFGIEFELPMRNASVASYKAAIQATLPGPLPKRLIQGIQVIGDVASQGGESQADFLYLLGVRWGDRWSTFSMTGFRRESRDSAALALVANNSIFFDAAKSIVLGVETNWKRAAADPEYFLLMPQIHWKGTRLNIQAGFGLTHDFGRTSGLLSWRISREF